MSTLTSDTYARIADIEAKFVQGSRRACHHDRMQRRASRSLVVWSAVLLVALAAHDLSHALDDGLETPLNQLALVAVPQWLALGVMMTVIVRAERARAAAAALLLGIGVTAGFLAIHLLPFSTASYWDLHPSFVSWLVAWLPAALGVAVAALGWSELRPLAAPAAAHQFARGEREHA